MTTLDVGSETRGATGDTVRRETQGRKAWRRQVVGGFASVLKVPARNDTTIVKTMAEQ
jgi:hypothetical protein